MNKKEVEARKAAREKDSPRAPKGEKPYDASPCMEWEEEEAEVRKSHLCLSAPTAESVERAQGAMPPVGSRPMNVQRVNISSPGAMPLVVAEDNNNSTQGAMPSVVAEIGILQRGNRGGLKRSRDENVIKERSFKPNEEGFCSLSGGRNGSVMFRLCQEKLDQAVNEYTRKRNKIIGKPVKDWKDKEGIKVAERIAKMYGDTLERMVRSGEGGCAYDDHDGITIQVCYDEDCDRFKREIFFNENVEVEAVDIQDLKRPTSETDELLQHPSVAAVVSKYPSMPAQLG